MSLFSGDESALRRIANDQLLRAYADGLAEKNSDLSGDDPEVIARRLRAARDVMDEVHAAAARAGCKIQLVALPHIHAKPDMAEPGDPEGQVP